ncbi:T7SS effector LXG polymorphic toxin [Alloiococcus sp. CFN-8]|uniref:T7SS effector LXG polymorphic toxin n=1 Tax=Alloiococcus sp. CFN-8 TaxID=3416081 RepID=UPI003CED4F4D
MAGKGDLFLDNNKVVSLYEKTKSYETTVLDALYAQYKNTYKISLSNHFRGDAADSFKNYITDGAINIITGMMDVSSEMTMIIQSFTETFSQYESAQEGKVSEDALDYIDKSLKDKKSTFRSAESELNAALREAAKYISVKALELDSVHSSYDKTKNNLKNIREDLYAADDEALKNAEQLMERIRELKDLIRNTMGHCYNDDGRIIPDNINNVKSQPWFSKSSNLALNLKLQEDPFAYSAGEVTVAEDQWAIGLTSDIYAYAGYAFLTASYEAGVEDGTAFIKAKAAVLEANGSAQFTDYLKLGATAQALYAQGEAKAGFSEEYVGFSASGEAGVARIGGSAVLGTEDLNITAQAGAEVLTADGKVALEFEEDGQFAVGVDAGATAAEATVGLGGSILSYEDQGTQKNLFAVGAGVEAGVSADFALYAESNTAFETSVVNINATSVKIKAQALLGVELNVTVPTPHFKWPW